MRAKVKEKAAPVEALVQSHFLKKDLLSGETAERPIRSTGEVVSIHKFVTEPAKVQVEYAVTVNLGNYESARIGVAVSVPCYTEELDRAYQWATKWAEKRIMQEQNEIRSALRKHAEDEF